MHPRLTLHRYLFTRFFKYLITINLFFVFLFNFIEFFEKLLRVKHSTVYDILHFLVLNLAPSFFEQLPISCWLTTCLLLRELYLQQEFETMLLFSLNLRKLFKIFAYLGISVACLSIIVNEFFVTPLTFKAEQYKMEHFKQISTQKIINKWLALEQNTYCYFSMLNLQTQKGSDLFLLVMSPQSTIQSTISAPHFYIDTKQHLLKIPEGKFFNVETNQQSKVTNLTIKKPGFFSQIKIHYEIPSIINLSKNVIFSRNTIPTPISNDLLAQLFKRLISYLLLVIYPLLTLGLFSLVWRRELYRWLIIFVPYPLITASALLADQLTHHGIGTWLAYSPYYLILVGLFALYRKLK